MVNTTWLGHAAFVFKHAGFVFMVDPYLDNPNCPKEVPDKVDVILITHGHSDHVGSTVDILKRNPHCKTYCNVEIADYLSKRVNNTIVGMNKGGSVGIGSNFTVTMVDAIHSSDITTEEGEILPGGTPAGFIIRGNGISAYFSGDTDVFGDMAIINDLYQPKYAFLCIGDHFTMGPQQAAYAVNKLLTSVETVIPMHYGTFPVLTGTPEELKNYIKTDTKVQVLKPGVPFNM